MILLIDWGNTFLKFIIVESLSIEALKNQKTINIAEPAELSSYITGDIRLALVCSVRSEHDNQRLKALLKPMNCQFYFAQTSLSACGVSCAYKEPKNLGVDRWLTIIAARKISEAVGIIDIGSAITVDVISEKKHLGGHILPGMRLMYESLLNTGRVRPEPGIENQHKIQLGRSTTDCVNFGINAAIRGYLLETIQILESEHRITHWIIAGGGGAEWKAILQRPGRNISLRPLLVFEGLLNLYIHEKH